MYVNVLRGRVYFDIKSHLLSIGGNRSLLISFWQHHQQQPVDIEAVKLIIDNKRSRVQCEAYKFCAF